MHVTNRKKTEATLTITITTNGEVLAGSADGITSIYFIVVCPLEDELEVDDGMSPLIATLKQKSEELHP